MCAVGNLGPSHLQGSLLTAAAKLLLGWWVSLSAMLHSLLVPFERRGQQTITDAWCYQTKQ
jgi:hypothetical protein